MFELRRRLRSALWKVPVETEVDQELQFHLAMRARELEAEGLSRADATETARKRFGNVETIGAECERLGRSRDRSFARRDWFGELVQDVRVALRQLRRAPGFTFVALLTLSVGTGATAAIFGALQAVVLNPFPWVEPARLVDVQQKWRDMPNDCSGATFDFVRRHATTLTDVTAVRWSNVNLAGDAEPERVVAARVSARYFALFGVPPASGRTFVADEDQPGGASVLVLSHRLWTRRFGGDPSVVGRDILVDAVPHRVIGIMPASFDFAADSEDLWLPLGLTAAQLNDADNHYMTVYGRLAPGVAFEQGKAELEGLTAGIRAAHPRDNGEASLSGRRMTEQIIGDSAGRLWLLIGAAALVLIIACANVASLLVARGFGRQRELALRAALGAGRARVVRQLVTESLVLGVLGAIGGVAVARVAIALIITASPPDVPRLDRTALDAPVLLFTLVVAMFSAILFGLLPAIQATRTDLRTALSGAGKGSVTGNATEAIRRALVAGQVACVVVLLAGVSLLARSAINLDRVLLGFRTDSIVAARVSLPTATYEEPERLTTAFSTLLQRLSESPGIAAVALSSQMPLVPGGNGNGLVPEGRPVEPSSLIPGRLAVVSRGYFETLGIRLVRGRTFSHIDDERSPPVMIVSETLARRAFGDADPVGKRIACCDGTPEQPSFKTVVGVVADVRAGAAREVRNDFYLPLEQAPKPFWTWVQRTMVIAARVESGEAAAIVPAIRNAVRSVDPTVAVHGIATMGARLRESTAQHRFNLRLLASLAVVALVVAAVGLYGVIAYFVAGRTREIGVRVALGAKSSSIVGLVLSQALRPLVVGAVVGVAGALMVTRLMRGWLFDVSPSDPLALAATLAVLALVGIAASVVPSMRAARIHPVSALRVD